MKSAIRQRNQRKRPIFIYIHIKVQELPAAKEVRYLRRYGRSQAGYYVCPGCGCTFEREYQHYCDRCGQKLAWSVLNQGKITVIRRISLKKQQHQCEKPQKQLILTQ